MFYIGQKVVCINSKPKFPVQPGEFVSFPKEGKIYLVSGLKLSPCCGIEWVDVGYRAPRYFDIDVCEECDCETDSDGTIVWHAYWRFVPIEDYEGMSETCKRANPT